MNRQPPVTPYIPEKPDHIYAYVLLEDHCPELLKAGVKIYTYSPGFIHAKVFLVDGKYSTVGTINLDYRSLVHHFEDGVFVIDSPVVDEAKKCYLETVRESDFRDNDEARLTPVEWAIRNLIKIFAPLL